MIKNITDAEFEVEVLQSTVPVVVDFSAPWCGPCKTLMPILEELDSQYQGTVKFIKINIEENPLIAQKQNVRSIPTLQYYKNGEVKDTTIGSCGIDKIAAKIFDLI